MADSPPPLIDTHAHLASTKLAADLDDVLLRASQAGVARVIAIGTTLADSREVVQLAHQRPGVFACVGIHPNDTADASPEDWSAIAALAGDSRVVALGETGLDRYWDRAPFALQQEYFDRHLILAHALSKPVVIHSRDCQIDVIRQIERLGRPVSGIQHSFTGTWEEAETLLAHGLHISFAGMITFENKALDPLREVAARVPLDRLLVETDSPYLSPHPFRGKRNEPSRVAVTAQAIAKIRGIPFEELAEATTRNASRLFTLPRP